MKCGRYCKRVAKCRKGGSGENVGNVGKHYLTSGEEGKVGRDGDVDDDVVETIAVVPFFSVDQKKRHGEGERRSPGRHLPHLDCYLRIPWWGRR